MNVENPKKWSAETPYLYTLRASMQGSNEVIPVKVGFRKIELKGDQILVNGKAVLFKGADRTKSIQQRLCNYLPNVSTDIRDNQSDST